MPAQKALSVLVSLLAVYVSSFAQGGKAELFGVIQDPSGLGVPKAKIRCTEIATGARFEILTDERGEYHLIGLTTGRYSLTVEKPGFTPSRLENISLRIGDQTRMDVTLDVGQSSQRLEVRGETTMLETASGSVSYHISQP